LSLQKESEIITIVSPGRVCLFGDHQDYLGLPVIACAINKHITLTAYPNTNETFVIDMPDIDVTRTINIHDSFTTLTPRDYFASGIRVVKKYECFPNRGFNLSFKGNIPINAGLSSSSAMVVSWIHFLFKAYGVDREITSDFIAQVAYEAEVLEHASPGGKMDQYTIGIGDIIFIETGDHFSYRKIPVTINGLVVGESGIPKETIGLLGNLQERTWDAINHVARKASDFNLHKATLENVEQYYQYIPENLQPLFYAAIKNHTITQQALSSLEKSILNPQEIGTLMTAHHDVLKNILKITVPVIDQMIEAALNAGAYGAKIVGSGGGGSIVALAPSGKEEHIASAMRDAGAKSAYSVTIEKGTHEQ